MKRLLILILATLALLPLTAQPSGAAEPFTVVSAQKLKALLDDKDNAPIVIDSRSRGEYDAAHIPGAFSLPLSQMTTLDFPRTSALAFYCSGAT